ncbi:site-specific integrase [Pedobacter frigiditerrae]|uniref:tyrosine-type recombinase/integrase n=1 Tax=Pedobacter frigiditerrae TaxID=2530452 RepID=UPI00292E8EDC|nr:site-specific integrase [Pedobacter frigiditerrae]
MFSEPKIVLTNDLSQRGYVTFHFNGVRYREYNGKKFNLDLNPNHFKTYNDRLRLFKKLSLEISKALDKGWSPHKKEERVEVKTIQTIDVALKSILQIKLNSDLSYGYKNDLKKIVEQFCNFLPKTELIKPIDKIDPLYIETFLNQFSSTATYYMNKRRALNVFFSEFKRTKLIIDNPVQDSLKKKPKAVLHKIYSKDQLNEVLGYLKVNYPNLHLCCLLAYGCFLRPHQEARLICYKHINEDCTKITLSGSENKSKRIRVVNIPHYVREELIIRLKASQNINHNILSNSKNAYNLSYLNTQWSRAKKKMTDLGILQKDQTIYSFRHTAAVNVYNKTKDLHILQQLLQHSNMIVTLNYLRGLGEINDERLKEVMPEL